TLSVRDRFPVEASITMTDPGTASSDELRLDLGARYHDFWRSGQVLGYNLGTSSEFDLDRSQSHSAFWVIPFYQTGDSLSFQAAYTKSSSSVILDDLQFRGTGVQASAQYTHILPRWGGWTHQLSWGPSYKFSENNLSLAGTPVTESETGLFSLQTQYAGTLQDKWGISSLTLIASGAPGNLVGADRSADYTRVRTGADPTFWNFNWGVGRSQQLPLEMVLNLKAQGQLVSGPLLSTEQFALGGINSVRGYNENQILSDEGVNLRAELLSPNLMKKVGLKNAGDFRLLVFTDYGSSHLLQPQAGQVAYEELLSAGTGVQYRFLDYLSAHVVFGQTLNELPGMTHDSRIHFQIRASY
ncbi:MAG: ShlB/FhaC/HecB family hemolysin secretion/activation protein, partial [Verrucomicrobiota bacterium]|nr:ShlB/FhaC/HecB family hemolysin secretion/activation protein [Verrucomicrobiota bacterium]